MKKFVPYLTVALSLVTSLEAWQESFESEIDSWQPTGSSSLKAISTNDGAPEGAVTEGEHCLELIGKNGSEWCQLTVNKDLTSEIKASTTLSFDVFVPQTSLPDSGWAKVQVRMYGGQGGPATFDITKDLELDLHSGAGKSYQVTWDYAADPAFKDDVYWAHIGIVTMGSGGTMSPIYIDNVKLSDSNELASNLRSDKFILGDEWTLVWEDDFDGAKGAAPAPHWKPGAIWSDDGTWRDATLAPEEAFLDGRGNIVFQTRVEDGKRLAPYLVTSEAGTYGKEDRVVFGPGEDGIFIEWRANVSEFKAHAAWFALWLFSDTPYEGDASLGSEIDVMEYVPFEGSVYSLMGKFNAAIHIADGGNSTKPPVPYGLVNFDEDVWHTWGLYWTKDLQVFYLDGKPYWINRDAKYISTDATHGLRMTIEIANGDPAKGNKNHWGHAVGKFEDNPADRFPAKAYVDYVRVYRKNASSASGLTQK